jgi:hypothetical protein
VRPGPPVRRTGPGPASRPRAHASYAGTGADGPGWTRFRQRWDECLLPRRRHPTGTADGETEVSRPVRQARGPSVGTARHAVPKKGEEASGSAEPLASSGGTPDRIRTGATALRGRRARPLHNGGLSDRNPSLGLGFRPIAGVLGLEPRLTGPEPVGLPITPYPMGCCCDFLRNRGMTIHGPRPVTKTPGTRPDGARDDLHVRAGTTAAPQPQPTLPAAGWPAERCAAGGPASVRRGSPGGRRCRPGSA